jgi:hypothetical protein
MTRQLFFAIILIGSGALLNSPASAQEWRCEDRAANCFGRCPDRIGAVGDDWKGRPSKCLRCDRQLIQCVSNANVRRHRYY